MSFGKTATEDQAIPQNQNVIETTEEAMETEGQIVAGKNEEEEDHDHSPEGTISTLEKEETEKEGDGEQDTGDQHRPGGQQGPSSAKRSRADVSSLLQFVSVAGCDIRAALDKSAPCKRSVDHRKYLQKQLCRFSHHHLLQEQQPQPPSPNSLTSCYSSTTSPAPGTSVSMVVAAPVLSKSQEEGVEKEDEEAGEHESEEEQEQLRDSSTGGAHFPQHYPSRDSSLFRSSRRLGGDERAGEADTLTGRRTLVEPSAATGQKLQLSTISHNKSEQQEINTCQKQWSSTIDSLDIVYTNKCAIGEGSPSDLISRETLSLSEVEEEEEVEEKETRQKIKVEKDQDTKQEDEEISSEEGNPISSPRVSSVSHCHQDCCMASAGVHSPTFPPPSLPSYSSSSCLPSQTSSVISTPSHSTMVVASSIPEGRGNDMELPGKGSPVPTTQISERDPLFEIPGVVNPEPPSTDVSSKDSNPKKPSIPLRQRQLPASFWKEPKPELKRGINEHIEAHHKGLLHAHGSFLLPYTLGSQGPKTPANSLMEYKALVDLYGSHYAGVISGSACDVPRAGFTQTDYLLSTYGSKLSPAADCADRSPLSAAASAAAYGTGGLYPWPYGILPGEAEKVVASRLQGTTHHPPHSHPPPQPPHSHQPLPQVAGHSGVTMRNSQAAVAAAHLHGHTLLYPHRQLGLGTTGHLSNPSLHTHHGSSAPEPTSVCSSWDPMATISQAQSLLRHPPAMAAASNLWRPIPTKTLTSYHSRFHPFPDVHRSMIDHALP